MKLGETVLCNCYFLCVHQVWCLEELELLDSIRGHENPVCTLVTKRNMLFSGSLKKIKVG